MQRGDVIQERYELAEIVGEGGMATVWRARDRRLGRDVAVKVLDDRLAQDPEYMVRFFSEAQAVARISNPNVVGILDFGKHEEHPYLVMECIEGGSAADLVGEPLLPERAIEMVQEAAIAAGSAHALGIVHRDIKPGNLLLTRDGRVRLADFGIATIAGAEPMTATGQAIGSPHYISPEQVSGASASPASDVYSLGVVLYELLTGRKPFDGNSITQVAIAHVERPPEPPGAHVPDLDPGLERVVMRCLAKDPDDRFSDGHELAAALDALASGDDYLDDDAVAPLPWWRRPAVIGAAAVALTMVVVAAVVAFGVLQSATPVARGSTEDQPDRSKKRRPSPTPTAPAVIESSASPSASPSPTNRDRNAGGSSGSLESDPGTSDSDGTGDSTAVDEPTPSPTPSPTASPTGDGDSADETTSTEATAGDASASSAS